LTRLAAGSFGKSAGERTLAFVLVAICLLSLLSALALALLG
jgi:hypothetical protein